MRYSTAFGDGQRTALGDHLGEVLPGEQLHDHEGDAVVGLAHVADARDVLAFELHRRARLAVEPGDDVGDLHDLALQELERHALVEAEVGGLRHDAHPPFADHPLDAEFPPEHLPDLDRKRHRRFGHRPSHALAKQRTTAA